ncbi:hypothetical protein SUGI_0574920 [Cryptomeria japonica]|nr:hypothetical protein SUGI_0574920 [Cryptomeria japonica]
MLVAPWVRVPAGHGGFPSDRGNTSWASVVKRGDGRERSQGRLGSPNKRQGFRELASNAYDSRMSSFGPHTRPHAMPEQRVGSLPSRWRSPNKRDIWGPSTSNAIAPAMPTSISLSEAVEKEVDHNELVFSILGLIGCFRGFWPSLGVLHKWISDHWEPIVDDSVQIYPHARGFFVVVFQTVEDRNKILGGSQWC